ncbi:MAG TPA: hypothetical protein VKM55_17015 [Candidatus Lokiarchaeia archaeon]|nr:hypothetical protein [Candidatus Lokiarchaeia archaeon]
MNFGRKYKMAWQHQRKQFIFRWIEIAVPLLVGIIVKVVLFYA